MRLAVKHRPRCFGEVVGQHATVAVLNRMAQRKNMPAAMLFYGEHGSGKTTSARILGAALNCEAPPGPASSWPCAGCPSCKAVIAGTSIDVIEIDAASNGSVDRIKEIRQLVQYGTAGEWRVVILDEAHSMSRDAFNALLKVLEEPPPNTVFILCTTEPGKIPGTVVSRCLPFCFRRIPVKVIAARLREVCTAEGILADDALLAHLADLAAGAMRDALMLLDQAAGVGICTLPAWQQLTGEEDYAPALIRAAASGNHRQLFGELDRIVSTSSDYPTITARLVACLRDILVLSAGGEISTQGSGLEERRALAAQLDSRRVVRAMSVLWDLQVRVRTEDRRAGLELAAVMVSEKLCPAPKESNGNGNGHKPDRMTAGDIRALEGFVG